jgi:N-acetylmuramoyl-L-alanine amidase
MKKIYLDAGHGGVNDLGVYSTCKEYTTDRKTWRKMWIHNINSIDEFVFYEGEFNRQISSKIKRLAIMYDDLEIVDIANPYLDTPLRDRVKAAKDRNAIYISIHADAFNGSAKGFGTFHYKGSRNSKRLAHCIQEKALKETKANDRKVRDYRNYYVLRKTPCPAVLIECGFFDHPDEALKLKTEGYQWKIAAGILKGIIMYFN